MRSSYVAARGQRRENERRGASHDPRKKCIGLWTNSSFASYFKLFLNNEINGKDHMVLGIDASQIRSNTAQRS